MAYARRLLHTPPRRRVLTRDRAPLASAAALTALCLMGVLAVGCGHGLLGSAPPSRSVQRFAAEASGITTVAYEEDFLDARLVLQALPPGTPERVGLRLKLVEYLIGPIARLDVEQARRDPSVLGSSDDVDRIFECFHDALDLYAPSELWTEGGTLSPRERSVLDAAARAVVTLFSPRGNEQAVATGLFVLVTLEPTQRTWIDRLDQLFSWLETGSQVAGAGGPRSSVTTSTEVLEQVASIWPTQPVVDRLTRQAFDRQDRLASALRRPLGTGVGRSGIGELLTDSEAMQAMAAGVAALHLRCGQIKGAETALAKLASKPGDDPELRQLVSAAARSGAKADDYLALARRFLPQIKLLGGTSSDRLDPVASAEVIRRGLERNPANTDLLILGSRVARFIPAPFLALRYLEDAQAVLERSRNSRELLAELASERLELSLSRLRVHIDPDHLEPAAREAEALRQQVAESRRRYGEQQVKVSDGEIDFEMARGYLDAGLVDRAEPLLHRAQHDGDVSVEVALQLGRLALKRGDPSRAAQIVREALEAQQRNAPPDETVPFVEAQSKLARALGDAYEVAGRLEDARRAWGLALRGWERLMIEQQRRKNPGALSEATFEVGRLTYLLGRHADGIQKFSDAIEQNESRDQTYIDTLAFLVQNGESDAALDVYRRVLSKPTRSVSEYVKVYSSLWILDITRRASKTPEPAAEGYLRSLEARKVALRPARTAAWYVPLIRYAIGRLTYDQLLAMADTAGKRAEVYFYEAMRRLAEGRSDDAHLLWEKVLETKMFSFFEFDMASKYLRSGAPTQPRAESAPDAEAI
jgi:tetratricopeptide (TPR) repeat protein